MDNHEGDDDADEVVSMEDVINEEEELEAVSNAVLGDSDDTHCTYTSGYLSRQALYACDTCSEQNDDKMSGAICLACSLSCHDRHDLYELYTKRQYRCDCGNRKFFPNKPCKLYAAKDEQNIENKYNHNFRGLYCTCERPYPDPLDTVEDEMIQCVLCEDWYHSRHVGRESPDDTEGFEMVCRACTNLHPWISMYRKHAADLNPGVITKIEAGDEAAHVDMRTESAVPKERNRHSPPNVSENALATTNKSDGTPINAQMSRERLTNGTHSNSGQCLLKEFDGSLTDAGVYLPTSWREKLCRCPICLARYKDEGVEFLLDIGDSIEAYERRGHKRQSSSSQLERGIEALEATGVDRVVIGELVHGYTELKDSLKAYLATFADRGQVVTAEDIKQFFGQMNDNRRKRKKVMDGMPPSQCK